jgi:peptide/nickel transport system permease protein
MIEFVLRRVAIGVVQALVVTAVLFVLLPLASQSNPAQIAAGGEFATPAQIKVERHILGLDRPVPIQYYHWLVHALHGNLGNSLIIHQSVISYIDKAAPVTLMITIVAAILAVLLGVPLGILAAWRPRGSIAKVVALTTAVGIAIPNFFVGLILARLLAVQAGWFPAVGFPANGFHDVFGHFGRSFHHAFLPGIALGIPAGAALARYTAAALSDVLQRDYVRTAVGKGLPTRSVVLKHSLKNAMIPVVTAFGLELRLLLGGSVAVEAVFAAPGIGSLAVSSVQYGDYPVIEGIALFALLAVTLINMAVDASYAYLNPRVRGL